MLAVLLLVAATVMTIDLSDGRDGPVTRLRHGAVVERDDLRGENAELRRLLGMRDRMGLRTVGARVLGTVPGDPGSSVLIDAGSDDGLAQGMTVLDDRGVVGRLVTVAAGHA